MNDYILKLYIAGNTSRSQRAVTLLQNICEDQLEDRYKLVIIDVLEHPQVAEDEKIFATPTLVKCLPPPLRRIIGDMTNIDKVLIGLDVVIVDKTNNQNGGEK